MICFIQSWINHLLSVLMEADLPSSDGWPLLLMTALASMFMKKVKRITDMVNLVSLLCSSQCHSDITALELSLTLKLMNKTPCGIFL